MGFALRNYTLPTNMSGVFSDRPLRKLINAYIKLKNLRGISTIHFVYKGSNIKPEHITDKIEGCYGRGHKM
ncbi:hypothetical protein MKW94_024497 [Papaver nudicaule]|uniref:Uncharacterized protein n=1 Tax=Papaver nudicaule TaxID=74823 RepID=A0AA41S554_PAPNU|nr:hypothetical protein [Papaver nudicaule]